jgi:glycosyltransferase involved in cell wall biosynthesis
MEKLKCLLVHNYEIENGGVSLLNFDLAEYLAKNDWDVVLFSPLGKNYEKEVNFKIEWKIKNLKNLVLNSDIVLLNPSPYLWPSIVETFEYCQKFQKPSIVWFHIVLDRDVYVKRYSKKDYEQRLANLRTILNNDLCKKIICVSKAVKNFLEPLVHDKEKIEVIYPGVKVFLGENESSPIAGDLLYVGRLSEEKNVDLLLLSLNEIKKYYSKIVLNIVGDGLEREKLINLTKKLGLENNVNFWGYLDRKQISVLYENHKVLILPSKIESLSLVAIESMFNELPLIASDTYGPKEIFYDLNYFLLFENGNVKDLLTKIMYVLKNYRKIKKVISEVKPKIKNKFNYESQMSRMEKLFLEILNYQKIRYPNFNYNIIYHCFAL